MSLRAGRGVVVALSSFSFCISCGDAAPTPNTPATAHVDLPPVAANDLRAPADFDRITDPAARSRALFLEASRVMLHPRCSNCHPADDSPRQGDTQTLHDPRVTRGAENRGIVAMQCESCHQKENATLARIPGAPDWRLAPLEMAWIGHSPADICEQVKDPARNGKRTLDQIVEHSSHDSLVAWAWKPGADRVSAPGSQEKFGALVLAWKNTGAVCPSKDEVAK